MLKEIFVSLDLETTGLDPDADQIIEIGAVKFCGQEILGTFETYIDPHMPIPKFIERLTGINQNMVENAPMFLDVVSDLTAFLGEHPIIAHNVAFDIRFLLTKGLRLTNKTYDTWDLHPCFCRAQWITRCRYYPKSWVLIQEDLTGLWMTPRQRDSFF